MSSFETNFDGLLIEPKGRRLLKLLMWMLRNGIEYYEDREINLGKGGSNDGSAEKE